MRVGGHAGPGGRGAARPHPSRPSAGGPGAGRMLPHKGRGVVRSEPLRPVVRSPRPPARPDTCGPPGAGLAPEGDGGGLGSWAVRDGVSLLWTWGLGLERAAPTAQSGRVAGGQHAGLPTCPVRAPGLSPAIRAGHRSRQDDSGSGAQPGPGGGLRPAPRGRLRGRAGASAATGRGAEAAAGHFCSLLCWPRRGGFPQGRPSCVHGQASAERATGSALRGRGHVSLQGRTPHLFPGVCASATPTGTDTAPSVPSIQRPPREERAALRPPGGQEDALQPGRPSPWPGHSSLGRWGQASRGAGSRSLHTVAGAGALTSRLMKMATMSAGLSTSLRGTM